MRGPIMREEGIRAFERGELDLAKKEFSAAIKIRPDFVEPRQNLAVTLAHPGEFDAAETEFREGACPPSPLGRRPSQHSSGAVIQARWGRDLPLTSAQPSGASAECLNRLASSKALMGVILFSILYTGVGQVRAVRSRHFHS